MSTQTCTYCGREAETQPDPFGDPVCTHSCAVSDVEQAIWDAVTDEDHVTQAEAVTRLAELLVTQNRRIEALEKTLADHTNEK